MNIDILKAGLVVFGIGSATSALQKILCKIINN